MEREPSCWYSAALGNVLLEQERDRSVLLGFHSFSFCRDHRSWFSVMVQNLWGYWWWSCLWAPFLLLCHYMCYPTCHLWFRKTLFSEGRAVILKSLLKITWDRHAQTAAAAVRKQTKMQCDIMWWSKERKSGVPFHVNCDKRRTSQESGAKKIS